jgi:hypothetical protein
MALPRDAFGNAYFQKPGMALFIPTIYEKGWRRERCLQGSGFLTSSNSTHMRHFAMADGYWAVASKD